MAELAVGGWGRAEVEGLVVARTSSVLPSGRTVVEYGVRLVDGGPVRWLLADEVVAVPRPLDAPVLFELDLRAERAAALAELQPPPGAPPAV